MISPCPGGQPAISEVLRMQSDVTCTEAKLIGGKLVFKGEVSVRMLYRSVEEDVLTADFVLPYSQIMDAAEAAENADFQIEVALLGWTLGELDYDGRSIPIDLELYACAEVRQVETVSLLADALQCPQEVTADYTPYTFPQLAERCVRRESKRELLETEEPDGTVLDLSTKTVQTTVTKGDGTLQVASVVEMTVLRVDDAGRVDALTRQVTVETELPVSGDVEVLVRSQVTDRSALPAANGAGAAAGGRVPNPAPAADGTAGHRRSDGGGERQHGRRGAAPPSSCGRWRRGRPCGTSPRRIRPRLARFSRPTTWKTSRRNRGCCS